MDDYPEKNKKEFSRWSYSNGWSIQVKNAKICWKSERYEDFSKWFHYNGWPVQVESEKSFQSGENIIFFKVILL
jgi:hypothetical protein